MSAFLNTFQILAQTAADQPLLYSYGPMGIILAWFMWRGERLASKVVDLAHRIDGLTKALLVDMIDRESSGEHTKDYAREAIAKIDARNENRDKARAD